MKKIQGQRQRENLIEKKNYFRGLKMRPTVPSDDEDADSFLFDPILRKPFLRWAAVDIDALAAREVSIRAVEGTDGRAADEETWSPDVDAWVMAEVATLAAGDVTTWAAEDKSANDVGAWSEVPGSILFRRREWTFWPIPRSGDE